jgi:hypothetical protein
MRARVAKPKARRNGLIVPTDRYSLVSLDF